MNPEPTVERRGAHLPHRFREVSFRKYERVVASIITSFPRPVVLSPGTLSATTFCCRLRDAMTSYAKHHWPTSLFTSEDFTIVRPLICICQRDDGTIVARPRVAEEVEPVGEFEVTMKHEAYNIGTVSNETLILLFKLAHNRQLVGPISFIPCHLGLLEDLKNNNDVFVEQSATNPNEYTIT